MISNENKILSLEEKNSIIQKATIKFKEFLEILQFDVENDQQLKDTPLRVAKMYVNELFSGCYDEEPKITIFKNTKKYDEMVFLGPIAIKSTCSHHIIPFTGEVFIAYVPDENVIGISKLARIIKWFMRRPQIQEELTEQIVDYVQEVLKPKGIACYIKAQHLCMIARGVEENNSYMKTSKMSGCFAQEDSARAEFFQLVNK